MIKAVAAATLLNIIERNIKDKVSIDPDVKRDALAMNITIEKKHRKRNKTALRRSHKTVGKEDKDVYIQRLASLIVSSRK